MGTYTIIKSFLMALSLLAAFSFFAFRIRYLARIMGAVKGEIVPKLDRIPERIKVLFTDVIAQSNVRRKLLPGLAHTLIFFGFLAVQPHSLELMIQGVFPGFHVSHWLPGIYGIYLSIADILALLVLVGLAYALYRRLVLKPKYLTNGLDAKLIILFTGVIIVSFHGVNAFQMVQSVTPGSFDYRGSFTVSAGLASVFSLSSLSTHQVSVGYELFLLDSYPDNPGISCLYSRFQAFASACGCTQRVFKTA